LNAAAVIVVVVVGGVKGSRPIKPQYFPAFYTAMIATINAFAALSAHLLVLDGDVPRPSIIPLPI